MTEKKIISGVIKLSKIVKKECGDYYRPYLMGAILDEDNNKMAITNGCWAVIYNKIYNDEKIILAPKIKDNEFDVKILEKIFAEKGLKDEEQILDIEYIKKMAKEVFDTNIKVDNCLYPAQQIINIYNTLENCKIFTTKGKQMLLLVGDNGKGFIYKMRDK